MTFIEAALAAFAFGYVGGFVLKVFRQVSEKV